MNINGKTKLLGVIGYPVQHSFSPQMHNSALAHLQLDYVYLALPVAPEKLKEDQDGREKGKTDCGGSHHADNALSEAFAEESVDQKADRRKQGNQPDVFEHERLLSHNCEFRSADFGLKE